MIEGNTPLTLDDLKTVEGVAQLNRMINQIYRAIDEDANLMSMILNTQSVEQSVT